jgi:hypothetical protein
MTYHIHTHTHNTETWGSHGDKHTRWGLGMTIVAENNCRVVALRLEPHEIGRQEGEGVVAPEENLAESWYGNIQQKARVTNHWATRVETRDTTGNKHGAWRYRF